MSNVKQLTLEQAEAGMQIAADLKDDNGNILLPSGASLTDASIKSLMRRGVTDICIISNEAPALDQRLEQERVKSRLTKLFRRSHAGDLDRLLMDYVSIYRIGKKHE
ncbi:hypothetical protein [Undibacterium sp.]|jgi:hypothetical protein|uniref:hypothetical protein n=1 Tax=Undibacterium sp. TaxID=1914977 RepID=UPI002B52D798|nr:hypothetical protein [Undibacterium sp.]HTD06262.1 hypothetical protein [Undibacterium sp.]